MKVHLMDIYSSDTCNLNRAAERIVHMRYDDAWCLAYTLRNLIMNSEYNEINLELSTDEPLIVNELTYEDIATLSKLIMRKPYHRSFKGLAQVARRINQLHQDSEVTCQSHKKGEGESHEN